MQADDDFAQLQKLSDDYQPELSVSFLVDLRDRRVLIKLGTARRAKTVDRRHHRRICQRRPRLSCKDPGPCLLLRFRHGADFW